MAEDRLAEIIRATATELEAAFNRTAAIQHRAQKGAAREDPVLSFVRGRLPRTVAAVGGGEVLDASGATSRQQDILIVDPSTPPFLDERKHSVYPSECVHGVIEVKSSLNKAEVIDACETIASVKRLAKTNYFPDPLGRTYVDVDGRRVGHRPTFGYVFAYASRSRIETLADNVADWCEGRPPSEWPDGLYIMGKGSITWFRDGVPFECLVEGARLGFLQSSHARDTLLTMALNLHMAYVTAWMPPFRLHPYVASAGLGVAKWSEPAAPSWPSGDGAEPRPTV